MMKKSSTLLLSLALTPFASVALAAPEAPPSVQSVVVEAGRAKVRPWQVRAEGSLVWMRDDWLGLPGSEIGLTVGRDLLPRLSVELTGSIRQLDGAELRSWSAIAAARWSALQSANGHNALTFALGPFLEVNNAVHGTLPFARGEVAYVYRAPMGLTFLAGAGVNVALADSPYSAQPNMCHTSDDSVLPCINLGGPGVQEIHVGTVTPHFRVAVGWMF
jgi:hypothetical protein